MIKNIFFFSHGRRIHPAPAPGNSLQLWGSGLFFDVVARKGIWARLCPLSFEPEGLLFLLSERLGVAFSERCLYMCILYASMYIVLQGVLCVHD